MLTSQFLTRTDPTNRRVWVRAGGIRRVAANHAPWASGTSCVYTADTRKGALPGWEDRRFYLSLREFVNDGRLPERHSSVARADMSLTNHTSFTTSNAGSVKSHVCQDLAFGSKAVTRTGIAQERPGHRWEGWSAARCPAAAGPWGPAWAAGRRQGPWGAALKGGVSQGWAGASGVRVAPG